MGRFALTKMSSGAKTHRYHAFITVSAELLCLNHDIHVIPVCGQHIPLLSITIIIAITYTPANKLAQQLLSYKSKAGALIGKQQLCKTHNHSVNGRVIGRELREQADVAIV